MTKEASPSGDADGYIPDSAYDGMDEEALEAERVEIPVPPEYFADLEPDQLDYDSEWEDGLDELQPDLSHSVHPERGCLVAWHCRQHPVPNALPGCELSCVWTRNSSVKLPNCFGFYRGQGLVDPGEPLYDVVRQTCRRCLQQRLCAVEYTRRNPRRAALEPED